MAKGGSELAAPVWNARSPSLNSDAPWPTSKQAEVRVLGIQRKLRHWTNGRCKSAYRADQFAQHRVLLSAGRREWRMPRGSHGC